MRGQPLDPTADARPTCYTCLRPATHCVCRLIEPLEAHCNIIVLQHPNEWRKYYSTTKLVARAVTNSRVLRGVIFEPQLLAAALRGQQPFLLFPSADSHDCESIALDSNCTVIAIDGTWSEAGKILRRNPILESIPRVSFRRPLRSNYRIRKQPKKHCLSTIESIAHLLKLNAEAAGLQEQSVRYDALLEGFARMIDQQMAYLPPYRTVHET